MSNLANFFWFGPYIRKCINHSSLVLGNCSSQILIQKKQKKIQGLLKPMGLMHMLTVSHVLQCFAELGHH